LATPNRQGAIWTHPEPGRRRPAHTREEIAAAALAIADAEGIDAVTMRRVARGLGAGTMTLYHYVRTKDDLLTLMSDALLGELVVRDDELAGSWRDSLRTIARRTNATLERHPWLVDAEAMRGLRIGPNGMKHFEQSLAAVAELALNDIDKLELIGQVDDYVFGYALRRLEDLEHAPQPGEEWPPELMAYIESQLESGDYPQIEAMFTADEPSVTWARVAESTLDPLRFDRGLERLLDGIELALRREGALPAGG
jgi:AcrR family transcriptional regulator